MKKILLIALLFSFGCSKEKILERRLKGSWKIDEVIFEHYEDNLIVPEKSFEKTDAGIFTFNEDLTGEWIKKYDDLGNDTEQTFEITEWNTTDTSVFISFLNTNQNLETIEFNVVNNEKNNQSWEVFNPNRTSGLRDEIRFKLTAN